MRIASSSMLGYFVSVDIPEVPAGEDIKATVEFYAINPGALYWKTFLIAYSPSYDLRLEVDATREIGEEGGRRQTYNLGPMPNKDIVINLFLFGHDDAGYDWSWEEFDRWLHSQLVEVQFLDTWASFLSPVPVEPPDGDGEALFRGQITDIRPLQFEPGETATIYISFEAYAESFWEQLNGWDTRVRARFGTMTAEDEQFHLGREGHRDDQDLTLGKMPAESLSGSVVLEARGRDLLNFPTEWVELDRKAVTIAVPGAPPPSEGMKIPWLPLVLIGGGVVVAATSKKSKPKS